MIPIDYEGNTYNVVRNWSEDELLAYRELGNESIEVLSMYCGMYSKARVHVGMMKMVMDAREFNQEQFNQEQQVILNAELDRAAGEEVQVA